MCGTLVLKRDAAHAVGRNGLLLHVDRFAIVVVRTDVNGARRTRRPDAIAGHVAVAGEHVHIVAQRLEVVRQRKFRVTSPSLCKLRHFLVGLLRQVAAEAARVPRRVAGDATHVLVLHARSAGRPAVSPHSSLPSSCHAHGFGHLRTHVVVPIAGRDRVGGLDDFPLDVFFDHRMLNDRVAAHLRTAACPKACDIRRKLNPSVRRRPGRTWSSSRARVDVPWQSMH